MIDIAVPPSPFKLAVLISGGGRTFMNLQQRILAGTLAARIAVVVSSREDCPGTALARELGLPTVVIERRAMTFDAFQELLKDAVAGADLVCMAGFLSLWHIPTGYLGRVINIHPALLPDFGGVGMYGPRVHEAVLAAGCRETGCTVHFCDNQYDHGSIILQRKVSVLPGDTPQELAARVFAEECVAYPQAIQLFAEGRISLKDGRVVIDENKEGADGPTS